MSLVSNSGKRTETFTSFQIIRNISHYDMMVPYVQEVVTRFFFIVTHYIKWVTTSWTHSNISWQLAFLCSITSQSFNGPKLKKLVRHQLFPNAFIHGAQWVEDFWDILWQNDFYLKIAIHPEASIFGPRPFESTNHFRTLCIVVLCVQEVVTHFIQ